MRFLLDFSGLLERDWSRARRADAQGNGNADGGGNPGTGGGGGGAGEGAGTVGRRIENMGALLEQLAPLIDWESEVCNLSVVLDISLPRETFHGNRTFSSQRLEKALEGFVSKQSTALKAGEKFGGHGLRSQLGCLCNIYLACFLSFLPPHRPWLPWSRS